MDIFSILTSPVGRNSYIDRKVVPLMSPSHAEIRSRREANELDRKLLGVRQGSEVSPMFRHGGGIIAATGQAMQDGPWLPHAKAAKRKANESKQAHGVIVIRVPITDPVTPDVVALKEEDHVRWALNPRHRAEVIKAAPFVVYDRKSREQTSVLTFYFVQGAMVRAHVGDPYPPLPWQNPLRWSREACRQFWRTHAYYVSAKRWNQQGLSNAKKPQWAKAD